MESALRLSEIKTIYHVGKRTPNHSYLERLDYVVATICIELK
jgi:hypothetical protein